MIQILQLLHLIWLLILAVLAMQILFPSTAGRGKSVDDTGFKSTGISAVVLALKKVHDSYRLRATGSNVPNGKPRADLGNVFGLPSLKGRWRWIYAPSKAAHPPHISHHNSQHRPSGSPRQLRPISQQQGSKQCCLGKERGGWAVITGACGDGTKEMSGSNVGSNVVIWESELMWDMTEP